MSPLTCPLASRRWESHLQQTTRHRVIVWEANCDHFGLFRLGKGGLFGVSGRPSVSTTNDLLWSS